MQVSGIQHRDSQFLKVIVHLWASLVVQTVKNLPTMQETQIQSPGREDLLEKGMAIYSSILAWRSPCSEEPGRLQCMGSQRETAEQVTHTQFTREVAQLRTLPCHSHCAAHCSSVYM